MRPADPHQIAPGAKCRADNDPQMRRPPRRGDDAGIAGEQVALDRAQQLVVHAPRDGAQDQRAGRAEHGLHRLSSAGPAAGDGGEQRVRPDEAAGRNRVRPQPPTAAEVRLARNWCSRGPASLRPGNPCGRLPPRNPGTGGPSGAEDMASVHCPQDTAARPAASPWRRGGKRGRFPGELVSDGPNSDEVRKEGDALDRSLEAEAVAEVSEEGDVELAAGLHQPEHNIAGLAAIGAHRAA